MLCPPFSFGNSKRCVAVRISLRLEFVLLVIVSDIPELLELLSSLLHDVIVLTVRSVKAHTAVYRIILFILFLWMVDSEVLACLKQMDYA